MAERARAAWARAEALGLVGGGLEVRGTVGVGWEVGGMAASAAMAAEAHTARTKQRWRAGRVGITPRCQSSQALAASPASERGLHPAPHRTHHIDRSLRHARDGARRAVVETDEVCRGAGVQAGSRA